MTDKTKRFNGIAKEKEQKDIEKVERTNNEDKGKMEKGLLDVQMMQMRNMTDMIENIYGEVRNIENRMNDKYDEVVERQDYLDTHIVLTRGETSALKSKVMEASIPLTEQFFKEQVSDELFDKKRGHTISYVWTVLKNQYDVSTYPEIPHVEFQNALNMAESITIHDFPKSYYKLTPAMQKVTEREIDHVQFGENKDQLDVFE